jgi:hypothetical protein
LNFATHKGHVLQPLIDRFEASGSRIVLFGIAFHLVKFAPNPFDCYHWYSDGEKEKAIALLKANGLGTFCNLSQRCKKQTLERILLAAKALEVPVK